ncbi:MAG: alanine racemase [bacterium]|nr:alanine racemase [bacterium]
METGSEMRPTCAEIDISAIVYNLKQIKKRVSPARVMAVVKADGYGHGVIPVARAAISAGVDCLGVALVEEATELRAAGIDHPVLVFGGAFENQLELFVDYDLELTVYTESIAQTCSRIAQSRNRILDVHVKVDTGMGRVGVPFEAAPSFVEWLSQLKNIRLKGIYTHFATSDEKDKKYASLQLNRFNKVLASVRLKGIEIPIKHAANSGAILDLPQAYLDMVRPGVMMYGYYPSPETSQSIAIKPAMTFKSKVCFIKNVAQNTSISYGRKYITPSSTRIATIPVGYADGYNRLLTNQGIVTIRGKKFPIVGRVCMDLIMADLGDDQTIEINDEVILFGPQSRNAFTVEEICQKIGTIPYEVTCWISKRVPRVYKY